MGTASFRGAFMWTAAGGMVSLGSLSTQRIGGIAHDASFDGSIIVGESVTDNFGGYPEAFRWTPEMGMVSLGRLPGSDRSIALAISSDGNTIVGQSNGAFIWTEEEGMRNLYDLAIESNAEGLEGWTFISATGVSADGNVIVGNALDPSGEEIGYYLNLNPIPLPGAAWSFLSALTLLLAKANFNRSRI